LFSVPKFPRLSLAGAKIRDALFAGGCLAPRHELSPSRLSQFGIALEKSPRKRGLTVVLLPSVFAQRTLDQASNCFRPCRGRVLLCNPGVETRE
jgi:hypothetical protein